MTDVSNLTARFRADTSHFDRGARHVRGEMSGIGSDSLNASRIFETAFGVTMGMAVVNLGYKLADLGVDVVNLAISWESAFAGVKKTVDGSVEDLARLEQGLLALSAGDSPVAGLENAAIELAGIAEAAGQLGIAQQDIMKFTETIAMLGMTTNLTGQEAAMDLARFANITQMATSDIDRLGSTIVALGNNTATTERDIVQMSTRLAAAGSLAGMSEAQIMALAAAMSSVGLEAEAGGTAMSMLLKQITTAVAEGGDELRYFARVADQSATDFAASWRTGPDQALQDFIIGLAQLDDATRLQVLEDLDLDAIRLSDTILRLAGNTNLLTSTFDIAGDAWSENTALIREAEQRAITTEAQYEKLKNQLKAFAVVIGSEVLPFVNAFVQGMQGLVTSGAKMLGIDLSFDVQTDDSALAGAGNAASATASRFFKERPIEVTAVVDVQFDGNRAPLTDDDLNKLQGRAQAQITETVNTWAPFTAIGQMAFELSAPQNPQEFIEYLETLRETNVELETTATRGRDAASGIGDFSRAVTDGRDSVDQMNLSMGATEEPSTKMNKNLDLLLGSLDNIYDSSTNLGVEWDNLAKFALPGLTTASFDAEKALGTFNLVTGDAEKVTTIFKGVLDKTPGAIDALAKAAQSMTVGDGLNKYNSVMDTIHQNMLDVIEQLPGISFLGIEIPSGLQMYSDVVNALADAAGRAVGFLGKLGLLGGGGGNGTGNYWASINNTMNPPAAPTGAGAGYGGQNALPPSGATYAEGGFTGYGGSSEIAGLVHRNEYVVPEGGALVVRGGGGGASINIQTLVVQGVQDVDSLLDQLNRKFQQRAIPVFQ